MADPERIHPSAQPGNGPPQGAARHESYGVNVRVLAWAVTILVVTALAIHLFLYWVFVAYERGQSREIRRQPLTGVERPPQVPPPGVPRVRAIPGYSAASDRAALAEFVDRNQRILNSYGPTTRPGFVRIPLDRAIDLALERQMLPVRAPATRSSSTIPGGVPNGSP